MCSRSSGSWGGAYESQDEIKKVPHKVIKASNGDARVEIRGSSIRRRKFPR